MNFEKKIIFEQEYFLANHLWAKKYFLGENIFWSKESFLHKNIFWPKKVLAESTNLAWIDQFWRWNGDAIPNLGEPDSGQFAVFFHAIFSENSRGKYRRVFYVYFLKKLACSWQVIIFDIIVKNNNLELLHTTVYLLIAYTESTRND